MHEGALKPVITKIEPNASPVLQATVVATKTSDRELMALMEDQILPQIKQTKGVAQIQMIGGENRAFRINVDNDKLKTMCLSLSSINQAIAGANV